jgi:hypothetical protein
MKKEKFDTGKCKDVGGSCKKKSDKCCDGLLCLESQVKGKGSLGPVCLGMFRFEKFPVPMVAHE